MSNTIFTLSTKLSDGTDLDFDSLKDKTLLIVNTASKCGFTPQYDGLQKLYDSYKNRGLIVIGFPCDQFGHQEPGDDSDIQSFCKINYGVTFPLTAKTRVNGRKTNPIFVFLKKKTGGLFNSSIKWNFTKFLVHRDGSTVKRYAPGVPPEELTADIEKAIEA